MIETNFLAEHETRVSAQSPNSPDLAPCDFVVFRKCVSPAKAYNRYIENWNKRWYACFGSGTYFKADISNLY